MLRALSLALLSLSQGSPVCEFDGREYDGSLLEFFACPALQSAREYSVAFTFSQAVTTNGFIMKFNWYQPTDGHAEVMINSGGLLFASINKTFGWSPTSRTTLTADYPTATPRRYLLTQAAGRLQIIQDGVQVAEDFGEHLSGGIAQIRFGGSGSNPSLVGILEDVAFFDYEASWQDGAIALQQPDCTHEGADFAGGGEVEVTGCPNWAGAAAKLSVAFTLKIATARQGEVVLQAVTAAGELLRVEINGGLMVLSVADATASADIVPGEEKRWLVVVAETGMVQLWRDGERVAVNGTELALNFPVTRLLLGGEEGGGRALTAALQDVYVFQGKVTWASAVVVTSTTSTTSSSSTTSSATTSSSSWTTATVLTSSAPAMSTFTAWTSALALSSSSGSFALATSTESSPMFGSRSSSRTPAEFWASSSFEPSLATSAEVVPSSGPAESSVSATVGSSAASLPTEPSSTLATPSSPMTTSSLMATSQLPPGTWSSTAAEWTSPGTSPSTSTERVAADASPSTSTELSAASTSPTSLSSTASHWPTTPLWPMLRASTSFSPQPVTSESPASTSTSTSSEDRILITSSEDRTSSATSSTSSTSSSSATSSSADKSSWFSMQELEGVLADVEAAALAAPGKEQHLGMAAQAFTSKRFSLKGWQVSVPQGLKGPESFVMALPEEEGPGFAGLVSLTAFGKGNARHPLRGLAEPIVVSAPATGEVEAVRYWHGESKQWRGDGVRIVRREAGAVVFATTHLTIFALVLKGFLSSFACAQLGLLSAQAFGGLFRGRWFSSSYALLFWAILLLLAALLLRARILDGRSAFKDEQFLIPLHAAPEFSARVTGSEEQEESSGCGASPLCSMAKDILDDVCARWFAFFGEARDLCEAVCSGLQVSGVKHGAEVAGQVVAALVAGNAKRQAGAVLGISDDTVTFVLEDEDLGELLAEAASTLAESGEEGRERRMEWLELHRSVVAAVDAEWRSFDGWGKVPAAAMRLVAASHPAVGVVRSCRLQRRFHRALLFACEVLGALALAALFFDGSGLALREGTEDCDSDDLGWWEFVGYLVGISMGSALLANMPVLLLASLQSRSLKKVSFIGSPGYQRQLRKWRLQDSLLMTMAGCYCGCCALFSCLFLANVAESELPSWGTGALIQAVEENLAIPLLVGILVPFFTAVALLLLAQLRGKSVGALLREQRASVGAKGNWQPFVHAI